jgi:hypothetical protein
VVIAVRTRWNLRSLAKRLGDRHVLLERRDRQAQRGVRRQRTDGASQQRRLEHREPGRGRRLFEQALTQQRALATPELVELDVGLAQGVGRRAEEREGAARMKADADDRPLLRGVDRKVPGVDARERRAAGATQVPEVVAVVAAQLVLVQVHQQLHAAARQDALACVWQLAGVLVVP